jgi:cytochrome c oxidase assembly factor CtaG
MSTSAVVMMVVTCVLVWGGFVVLLLRAVRKEGRKASDRIDEHPPHPSP